MEIEVRSLMFDNLLVYEVTQPKEEWHEAFLMMEDFPLNVDVYKNGPIFFSVVMDPNDETIGHYTYYLPINESVALADEKSFRYLERFHLDEALVSRQVDGKLNFSTTNQKMNEYAKKNKIELEDIYYCVILEVYDEYIIDLFMPVKGSER